MLYKLKILGSYKTFPWFLSLLLLFLLTGVLFYRVLIESDKIIFGVDIGSYYYFYKSFFVEELKKGNFPLWLPYVYLGIPFLPNPQIGCFYPSTILYLFLPLNLAFGYDYALHIFLAGVFMFILMKNLVKDTCSSLLSALTFMFSGFFLFRIYAGHISMMGPISWLPLGFLFFRKAIENNHYFSIYTLLTGLVIALMFFVGHPPFFYYSLFPLITYAFFQVGYLGIKEKSFRIVITPFLILIVIGIISCSLTAVQLLPGIEGASLSNRIYASREFIYSGSLNPLNSISLFIAPHLVKNSIFGSAGGWESCIYIGFLPLFFSLLAIYIGRKDPLIKFFISLSFISLLMAYGSYTPFFPLASHVIPGLSLFRQPCRFVVLIMFSMAILTGFGYKFLRESILERIEGKLRKLVKILVLCLTFFSLIILLNGLYYNFYLKINLRECLTIPFIWLGLSSLVLIVVMLIPRPRCVRHLLILGLTVADLWYFGAKFIYPEDPVNFTALTIEEKMIEARYRGRKISDSLFRLEVSQGWNRFIYYHIFITHGVSSFLIDDYLYFRTAIYSDKRLLDLLNVKYILTAEDKNIPEDHYEKIADNVYRNKEFLARARWVNKFIIRRGRESFYIALRHPEFNYRDTVILEEIPEELRQNIPPIESNGTPEQPILISIRKPEGKNDIKITYYSTDKIVLESNTFSDGLLVLSELYYPGWKAFVDGCRKPIYKTDLVLRGIFLPQGQHQIEFIYDPLSFKLGLNISVFAWMGLFIWGSFYLWKRFKGAIGPYSHL